MKRVPVVTLLAAGTLLVVAGCGGTGSDSNPSDFNNERTIGNPAVYERIAELTSCTKLHEEFSIAGGNSTRLLKSGGDASVPLSYMSAANIRMQEVGCYG